MKPESLYFLIAVLWLSLAGCSPKEQTKSTSWCDQKPRAAFSELHEVKTKSTWYKVYEVGKNVYAIAEPFNFQEVISYLILGKEDALLFDTGMGLDSISPVVKELTGLPVTVINSHTHYDHIGGNHEFYNILAFNTNYTLSKAVNGWSHDQVSQEISSRALCLKMLPQLDTASYHIRPFAITEFIADGHVIDLGGRKIEVMAVPGHTPDGIALVDRDAGYLWTGDTFYEAPIWLFFDGTDLDDYFASITRLAALSPSLKRIFPAHNTPIAEPRRLVELKDAFAQVLDGTRKAKEVGENGYPADTSAALFEFDHFSFLIRKDYLKIKGVVLE